MNDVQDEIAAIQNELGTDPSGTSYNSVKARIAALETGKSDTTHNHDHNTLTNLTTGDPHTQYVAKAIATTKGDMLAATAASTIARVPVGANGTQLVADSAQAAGMRWAANTDVPNSVFTAKGVLVAGTGASTYAALAVGADGRVLVADSATATGLNWSASAPALKGEYQAKGQIMVGSGAGTTVQRGAGTDRSMFMARSASADGVVWANNPRLGGYSEIVWSDTVMGPQIVAANSFNVVNHTLIGDTSYTFDYVPAGESYSCLFVLTQDATGGRAVTFPAGTKWQNGSPPAPDTGPNKTNIFALTTVDGGSSWFGFLSGKGMA